MKAGAGDCCCNFFLLLASLCVESSPGLGSNMGISTRKESTGMTASRPIHHPRDSFAMIVRISLERANAL